MNATRSRVTQPDAVRSYDEELRCGFCAKRRDEVRTLVAGPLLFICDECVDVCAEIIKAQNRAEATASSATDPARVEHSSASALIDRVAGLSPSDQWSLVVQMLARLRHRGLTS